MGVSSGGWHRHCINRAIVRAQQTIHNLVCFGNNCTVSAPKPTNSQNALTLASSACAKTFFKSACCRSSLDTRLASVTNKPTSKRCLSDNLDMSFHPFPFGLGEDCH